MEKSCTHCHRDFVISEDDQVFYEKFGVPPPQQCPDCRLVRRFMERNSRNLYYRTCDFTGKKTLSQYHEEQPFPVYSPAAWWSDDWDATKYGRDFDFSRPFFDQFLELKKEVPHLALFNTEGTMENSDFNNCTAYIKNCYLIAESDYCEDCYYSNLLKKCTSVVDCSICYDDELCYECVDCQNCYNLLYSQDCQQSTDSAFLKNCISCKDCIGCINERQKQYMIFNKQYSREEYEGIKRAFELDTASGVEKLRQQCDEFFKGQPHKAVISEHNQNSSGDHLFNSKNAFHCFDSKDLEDCRYCAKLSLGVKSSMDYNSWGNQSQLMYQSTGTGDHCYNCMFCVMCQTNMVNCAYCYECFSCTDCFGCIGLKKKKFCILNKQYSEEEYRKLLPRIFDHMKKTGELGEFFPTTVCGFGYNESIAMDIFPLTKKQALEQGFPWKDEVSKPSLPQTYNIPERIEEVTDDITDAILTCSSCKKNYKIIAQELSFYKKLEIPVPRKCANCRHQSRMQKRNPLRLWERSCANCDKIVQTSFAPDKPEPIYCEECYLSVVY